MVRKILLLCGILSSVLYIGLNAFVPMLLDGYDITSQTVSELSAIDVPTRSVWMIGIMMYTALLIAFGWGVRISAGGIRALNIVGILIILHAVFGLFWPPMHQREVLAAGGGTISDTLHIAWTAVTIPLMMLEIGFGASAFGKGFRWYSYITILILITFGVLTGFSSPEMEANLPTPLMGVWERISIAGFMVWVIVFAVMMLQKIKIHELPKGYNM